jgi:transposase
MEPTWNAWVRLAARFRRRGAKVVLVPPERSADLRKYYSKHAKSDQLDSQLLGRLPMPHPDRLYAEQGLWPGDALKRAAKLHSTLTHRRSQSLARPDALLEILGPAWHARLALQLTEEIKDLDERTALLLKHADSNGILTSAPGVAAITAAAILGRLGDPNRFNSVAGARAFTGLVPILDSSEINGRHGTKQTRRRGLAAGAVHGRRTAPPNRPDASSQIPPA